MSKPITSSRGEYYTGATKQGAHGTTVDGYVCLGCGVFDITADFDHRKDCPNEEPLDELRTEKHPGKQKDVVYGRNPDLSPEDAEEVIKVVVDIDEEQKSTEHAALTCWSCGLQGYALCCHIIDMEDSTPETWRTVPVCTDCADRDDPLCGVFPEDLDHELVKNNEA